MMSLSLQRRTAKADVEERISSVNRSALAREMGLDRTHVSKVLSGGDMPSLPVAAGMAKILGITLDDFYEYLSRRTQPVN